MKYPFTCLLLAVLLSVTGCVEAPPNKPAVQPAPSQFDTLGCDTLLKVTVNQEDIASNEYLADRLKPIRANFKRINSITKWTSVVRKDLWQTTEGGDAVFYYTGKRLEKIITRRYGEVFQQLSEYYLLDGKCSFVLEKTITYNRPIYYDSAAMKENSDTEVFDISKSAMVEDRSYFEQGQLIHQLNNVDCGSPFAPDYLETEQRRITVDFQQLQRLAKTK